MPLSKLLLSLSRWVVAAAVIAGVGVGSSAAQEVRTKIENTDPAQRLEWYDQHMAMKAETPFKDLEWRFIGPDIIGGRATDVEVPKGSRLVIYAGSATGGAWKTENAGITWTPIFDDQATQSIGDIAVSESDPNIVWIGTGEANIFRASTAGSGVYKSTDAGKTWTHMGLAGTQTIGRIVIHPNNPDIVYVAASGHEWTENPDRGVFKTTDGGRTWEKVLYINERVGVWDLAIDPTDPNTVYASSWNRIRQRWSDPVPGGEDGLHKTTDGGRTWKPINNGLPDTGLTGRIGISLCLSKPNVLYAFVDNHNLGREAREGERDAYGRQKTGRQIVGAEVYRSDDRGEHWTKVSVSDATMETFGGTYGWVFGQIRVDPSNENTVYILGLGLYRSTDGGKSWTGIDYEGLHGDHHALWIDPEDSNYLINGNDGGVNLSYDGGASWRDFHKEIPTIQFYNVSYDMATPFHVYGSVQDHNTHRGRVDWGQSRRNSGVAPPVWERAPGGEGTLIAIDPNNTTLYSSTFYGRLQRSEYRDGVWESTDIAPQAAEGEPPLRGQWLAPTILSPHDPSVLYHGFQYVFRSRDRGNTWERISDDLSYNDPEKQGKLPYAIPYASLTALSESPLEAGILYAGTDDGRAWVTRNDGANWTEITAGLPYNKHVWSMSASKYEVGTVYVTLIGRHDDDFNPYMFKSTDFGETWTSIAGNLPGGPVNVVREDPRMANVLYAGSDLGVYASIDGGGSWNVVGSGLPNTYVWDLVIHPRDNTLVIATNGRGMWVIDDVSMIQNFR
jgi:photosystem II stability/assembly factor-like uncharacterized protein